MSFRRICIIVLGYVGLLTVPTLPARGAKSLRRRRHLRGLARLTDIGVGAEISAARVMGK